MDQIGGYQVEDQAMEGLLEGIQLQTWGHKVEEVTGLLLVLVAESLKGSHMVEWVGTGDLQLVVVHSSLGMFEMCQRLTFQVFIVEFSLQSCRYVCVWICQMLALLRFVLRFID
jgi:hypothetical protein